LIFLILLGSSFTLIQLFADHLTPFKAKLTTVD
jgi:hypothetical protein